MKTTARLGERRRQRSRAERVSSCSVRTRPSTSAHAASEQRPVPGSDDLQLWSTGARHCSLSRCSCAGDRHVCSYASQHRQAIGRMALAAHEEVWARRSAQRFQQDGEAAGPDHSPRESPFDNNDGSRAHWRGRCRRRHHSAVLRGTLCIWIWDSPAAAACVVTLTAARGHGGRTPQISLRMEPALGPDGWWAAASQAALRKSGSHVSRQRIDCCAG